MLVAARTAPALRLDQALARLLPQHSRSRLQAWLRDGRITLMASAALTPSARRWGGERIEVSVAADPSELPAAAEDIALSILYEDDDILVINKPVGLVVHPGKRQLAGHLLNALLHHAPQLAAIPRAGIVHRLGQGNQRPASRLRRWRRQTDLVRQLQARTVSVITGAGAWRGDRAMAWWMRLIGRHPTQRIKMAVGSVELERQGGAYALRGSDALRIDAARMPAGNGRTHQIRVHMSSISIRWSAIRSMAGAAAVSPLFAAFPRSAACWVSRCCIRARTRK